MKAHSPHQNALWLKELREYVSTSDLREVNKERAAEMFFICVSALQHSRWECGASWTLEYETARWNRFESDVATGVPCHGAGPYFADLLGFYSANSFYRAFQVRYGMTYTDWKKQQALGLVG